MKLPLSCLHGRLTTAAAVAYAHCRSAGFLRTGLFVVTALLATGLAHAADGVVSQLSALKQVVEKNKDGKVTETYTPVVTVVPGDVLLCTVEYRNAGREPASNVVVTLPVPPEMTLMPDSERHAEVETLYSVDGGSTFDRLERLTVAGEDGNPRPARPQDVNSIRWSLRRELAPGQQGKVSYLATLR